MLEITGGLAPLSDMVTPALLISACGTLIFSTSTRLARIVDRVRALIAALEQFSAQEPDDLVQERRQEVERQLASHTRRGRLIQGSLTSLYVALGLFVATTVSIGISPVVPHLTWLPSALGMVGTLALFYGCVLLIRETRLALASVDAEMTFVLRQRDMYQNRRRGP